MLGNTVDRVRRLIVPQRLLVSVNNRHREFAEQDLGELDEGSIIVQPENRETCAGILLSLLHIQKCDAGAYVCIFPADGFVRQETRFMEQIESATKYVVKHPQDLLLVGVEPQYPETDYGWIEPSEVVAIEDGLELLRVRKFWEKPSFQKAEQLARRGCLWNTMVMVGCVATFLDKFRRLTPDFFESFRPLAESLGFPQEKEIARQVYASLPRMNFSTAILEREVHDLVVLPAKGVYWSDWGRGERIEMDLALMTAEGSRILGPQTA
jgi:mannose-1-phosphate guanylyltransferase